MIVDTDGISFQVRVEAPEFLVNRCSKSTCNAALCTLQTLGSWWRMLRRHSLWKTVPTCHLDCGNSGLAYRVKSVSCLQAVDKRWWLVIVPVRQPMTIHDEVLPMPRYRVKVSGGKHQPAFSDVGLTQDSADLWILTGAPCSRWVSMKCGLPE